MSGWWKDMVILLIIVGVCSGVMFLPPVAQDPVYHAFADQRVIVGIPRFLDIITNLPFLIVGVAGLLSCRAGHITRSRRSWTVFFAGVALVGIGSGYYHADPIDRTLIWDRLPMSVGFMGILVAVLSERIGAWIETDGLAPAVFAGVMSVLWWAVLDDLRPYGAVQLLPVTVIPTVLLLYPEQRSEDRCIMFSMVLYVIAKVFEHYDHAIYAATGYIISGHSLKHLAAAAGCAAILVMLKRRISAEGAQHCSERERRVLLHRSNSLGRT
ncbi:MAG: ceramidase domain-containing protein [Nitrospirota bacterium]